MIRWSGWLEKIMYKLGSDDKWCALIMNCVTTISYSVKINGKPKGHIVPSRRIRQGDPLSPYLFLLYAICLSDLIKKEVENGGLGVLQFVVEVPKYPIFSFPMIA